MKFAIFIVWFALYFYEETALFAQTPDNSATIDFSATDISIERPFTISLLIRDSNTRPTVAFPDIPGLSKQGITINTTVAETGGREVTSQLIVQTYLAARVGSIRVPPFVLTASGLSVRSPGTTLTVRPTAQAAAAAAVLAKARTDRQAAFLQTSVNKTSLYTGDGLRIRLSFFVAETYPYTLRFDQLAEQVATVVRRLRPVNAWEENDNITELTPRPVVVNGKKYVEYRIYQATFFLLASRNGAGRQLVLPAVPLTITRQQEPVSTPATSTTTAGNATAPPKPTRLTESVTFTSQPVTVEVKPLPRLSPAAQPGQVSVGTFRLIDRADRSRVAVGQSVQYDVRLEGQGNIAGIQAPQLPAPDADLDLFPPQVQEQIDRVDGLVSGYKSFRYFLIPKRTGTFSLASRFFWVYFDPQSGRYDTLRPQTTLTVVSASDNLLTGVVPSDTLDGRGRPSIYAGLEQVSSTEQTINWPVLIRAAANVLIILMLLGTLFVFVRK